MVKMGEKKGGGAGQRYFRGPMAVCMKSRKPRSSRRGIRLRGA